MSNLGYFVVGLGLLAEPLTTLAHEHPNFVELMVVMWKRQCERMRDMTSEEMFAHVKEAIEDADIAIGVWQDDQSPHGIGMYTIKGARRIMAVVASGNKEAFRTAAIPCVELEQAIAAEKHFGDRVN
jgi:hypothetical protein